MKKYFTAFLLIVLNVSTAYSADFKNVANWEWIPAAKIDSLIQAGADVNVQNKNGKSMRMIWEDRERSSGSDGGGEFFGVCIDGCH